MIKIGFDEIKEQVDAHGISKAIIGIKHPLVVSGIPENRYNDFRMYGFDEYAIFQDYWIDSLVPPGEQYSDYTILQSSECFTASEISAACREQSRGFEGESPEWFSEWIHNQIGGVEGMKNTAVLTCKLNGQIAGISCTATYAHDSEKGTVVWVRMMAVHPNFQGHGIGTKLLMQTLQYGAEHGAKRAFLHVDIQNETAIKIYLKAGFRPREDEKQIDMIRREKYEHNKNA